MKGKENKKNQKIEEKEEMQNEELDEQQVTEEEQAENEMNAEKQKELENEISELKDKLLRKAAEFENYKRRTENDQLNLLKYAAESLIIKLLPVVDDFERSLQHMDSAKDVDTIKKGVQLIYEKLMKVLEEQGVKKIEAVGQPFNVDFHEALMQRKEPGAEPHTVLDEVEKGYVYKDRVIRHSKVIVSEELTGDNPETENEENNSAGEGK